jgi:hypothetical protein
MKDDLYPPPYMPKVVFIDQCTQTTFTVPTVQLIKVKETISRLDDSQSIDSEDYTEHHSDLTNQNLSAVYEPLKLSNREEGHHVNLTNQPQPARLRKRDSANQKRRPADSANDNRPRPAEDRKIAEQAVKKKQEAMRTRRALAKLDKRRRARESWNVLRTRLIRQVELLLKSALSHW